MIVQHDCTAQTVTVSASTIRSHVPFKFTGLCSPDALNVLDMWAARLVVMSYGQDYCRWPEWMHICITACMKCVSIERRCAFVTLTACHTFEKTASTDISKPRVYVPQLSV